MALTMTFEFGTKSAVKPRWRANYQQKLDVTPTEAAAMGLAANWQMDGFNGASQVVDIVSGSNLSIGHATGGASPPALRSTTCILANTR